MGKLPEHTVSRYEYELEQLRTMLLRMFGMVENQFSQALIALQERNLDMARKIAEQDREIDEFERSIETFSIKILALRSPLAIDLREIVAALKISSDLERIGDLASGICRRLRKVDATHHEVSLSGLLSMGRQVQEMLRETANAMSKKDETMMVHVWNADLLIDDLYTSVFRELTTYMMEDQHCITTCSHLLFMAKNIERIGDHITNIVESTYYVVTGEMLPYLRPHKRNRKSLEKNDGR